MHERGQAKACPLLLWRRTVIRQDVPMSAQPCPLSCVIRVAPQALTVDSRVRECLAAETLKERDYKQSLKGDWPMSARLMVLSTVGLALLLLPMSDACARCAAATALQSRIGRERQRRRTEVPRVRGNPGCRAPVHGIGDGSGSVGREGGSTGSRRIVETGGVLNKPTQRERR